MAQPRTLLLSFVLLLLLLLMFGSLGHAANQLEAPAGAARVVELHIDQEIEPVLAEYVNEGIAQANRDGASLILIVMDTPGGLDTSMRDIIQHIIDSSVPVVVYVAPAGARAASAGFFVLLAADVAAMAPGTHTGAASPVAIIGGAPVTLDETMRKKIVNDATAYMRSYAGRRGRDVALAETAITEAKAFTEQEAVGGKLCDLVARSRDELLATLDGRVVTRVDGRTTRLALAHPRIVAVAMSTRQRILSRAVQPDMLFVLLLVGVIGLYVEFTHPGMVAPGVVGAIALLLALFAMHLLPINLAGVLLTMLALALFVLEAKYTSYGALAAGGIVAMLLGALILVRSPLTGGGVSLGVAAAVTLPFAAIVIFLMRLVLRSRAWAPQTGIDELVRETGTVTENIDGAAGQTVRRGMVFVHGALWQATSGSVIPAGTRVRVVGVQGLTLSVEPTDAPPNS